jgi:hypothetical protein
MAGFKHSTIGQFVKCSTTMPPGHKQGGKAKVDLQYKVFLAKLMRRLLKIAAYDKFKICHKINYKINWSSTKKNLEILNC